MASSPDETVTSEATDLEALSREELVDLVRRERRTRAEQTARLEESARQLAQSVEARTRALSVVDDRLREESASRQLAEAQVREGEARYRAVVESQTELICRFAPDGAIDFINEALCTFFGRPRQALLSQGFHDLIAAADRAAVDGALSQTRHSRSPAVLETRVARPRGEERWVRWTLRAIGDTEGGIVEYQAVGADITETKALELQVRQRQQALEAIYSLATRWNQDLAEVCARAAAALAGLLDCRTVCILQARGQSLSTLVRLQDGQLQDGKEEAPHPGPCHHLWARGEPLAFRKTDAAISEEAARRCLCAGGTRSFAGAPLMDSEGGILGLVCALDPEPEKLDEGALHLLEIFAPYIAFQLENDQLQRRLQAHQQSQLLGQIAASVAHEVRAPLNAIQVSTEVLEKALAKGKEPGKYFGRIRRQVDRLSTLMGDLLELRRPVADKERRPVRLLTLCRSALDIWRHGADGDGRSVEVDAADEAGAAARVLVDAERTAQVLLNLLQNAAAHSEPATAIRLETAVADGWGVLRVVDEGAGIPEEKLEEILEPFVTTRPGGTGLGLCIVKSIVERQGGTVALRNNRHGPGCTAEVRLPLHKEPEA
jgi:PAS domain S-box-containing protein